MYIMYPGACQGEVVYRFARCKQPLAMRAMYNCGLPLPDSHVDVLEPALRWEELKVSVCQNAVDCVAC